jgi:hypothetical protein
VLRLAPFTEREIRTAVTTTVRLIEGSAMVPNRHRPGLSRSARGHTPYPKFPESVLLTIRFFVFCEEVHQAAFLINCLALA